MSEQSEVNLIVELDNLDYRLKIIEAVLNITDVYLDRAEAQKILSRQYPNRVLKC